MRLDQDRVQRRAFLLAELSLSVILPRSQVRLSLFLMGVCSVTQPPSLEIF
jgi:hypothetical protein